MWISNNLKPSKHCSEIVHTCEKIVRALRRRFEYLTIATFLPLYKALIRPRLEYASCCWCPHYVRDIKLVEDVQRRATKLIHNLRELEYLHRLRVLKLQTLETRRTRSDLIMIYKMAHGLVDIPLQRFFTLCNTNRLRGHPLKLNTLYTARKNCALYSFAFRTVRLWNNLPAEIVTSPSLPSFKTLLHESRALPEL